jgi:hypothetical protein
MRRIVGLPASVLPAALLLGCAPAAQRAYVAPSNETVVSTTEEHEADPPAHIIYVENHSTVPVRIFAIRLTDCENVNVTCGVRQMNLRLDPDRRQVAVRIEPKNRGLGFHYSFGFSWHVDSASAIALATLAQAGDSGSRVKLAAMQHADSLRRAETGPHYNELSQSDFSVLGPRVVSMRAIPDSLVLVPGERTSIERIRLLLLDKQGTVLGQTRWVSWRIMSGMNAAVQFDPPTTLVAKRPGRTMIRFSLAQQAQQLVPTPISDVEYTIVAAYPPDPHAPVFTGRALDADGKTPLACASVALEDSAQNVVARARSGSMGTFVLVAPRTGTYRVRVDAPGWAPVYGPSELAKADEEKQHEYVVKFTEQMLSFRGTRSTDDAEHARPVSLVTPVLEASSGARRKGPNEQSLVGAVTLGGSETMPILGIVGRAPAGTSWMQFVVDSTGHVEPGSISLPADTSAKRLASAKSMLPRVHFAPARDGGKAVCELLRMQVNFSAR